jgi:hypothetical protein
MHSKCQESDMPLVFPMAAPKSRLAETPSLGSLEDRVLH